MAARDTVRIFITGDSTGFKKAVGDVEKSASGLSGKVKGALAGIGVAAVGRSLLNAANGFKDAALEAKNFATTSGLATDEASRLLEVSKDLGLESSDVSTAVGRLAKNLATSGDKLAKFGVTAKRTANGQVDLRATFLGAIDALKNTTDPLKRAELGVALFGKSWQTFAPLIDAGAAGLADRLNAVGDAQVFTDEEVAKAQKFRDAQDNLSDSVQALQFNLASGLMPALSTMAGWLSQLDPKIVAIGFGTLAAAAAMSKLQGAIKLLTASPEVAALIVLAAVIAKMVEGIGKLGGQFTPVGFTPEAAARINARAPGTIDTKGNATGVVKDTRSNWQAIRDGIKGIFADGGFVPGPIGEPALIMAHGGELVLNREQQRAMGGSVINIYMPNARLSSPEDARRLAVELNREAARRSRGGAVA